jgi:WD40 repeat protein
MVSQDAGPADDVALDQTVTSIDASPGTCADQTIVYQGLGGWAGPLGKVAFSPDGQKIATSAGDHKGLIFRVSDGALISTLYDGCPADIYSVAFFPDGQRMAALGCGGAIEIWDGNLTPVELGFASAFAISPDGRTLADNANPIRLWNVGTGVVDATFTGHTGSVTSVAFSRDGLTLASAGADATVRLWNVASGALLTTLTTASTASLASVAISPTGTLVAALDKTTGVQLWSLPDYQSTGAILTDSLVEFAFTPDGKSIVTAGPRVGVYSVADRSLSYELGENTYSVAVSPDGTRAAAGEAAGVLKIFCLR